MFLLTPMLVGVIMLPVMDEGRWKVSWGSVDTVPSKAVTETVANKKKSYSYDAERSEK